MGSYASVAVRDAAGNIVGYVSTSTGQVVETTGAGSASFQQIQAQYAQQRYASVSGAGAYQQSIQHQYIPETAQFSKDAAGIAAEVYLRTGGRGAVDFNLGMEAVRPPMAGESKNTIDPRYVNVAGVNELGQRVNVNLVDYARGNARVGGLAVVGIDTGVHTAKGDWGPSVITSTEMQRQTEFIQAVEKKPFLSTIPSSRAPIQETPLETPTGTFKQNVNFFGMLGLGGYEAGQRAFTNVTQGRHPAVDAVQANVTKNITGSKVLASVPAVSSLSPDSGATLWTKARAEQPGGSTPLTGGNLPASYYEQQAMQDVTKRPGYTVPGTLGDSQTRAITAGLALMRGAGFNVATPDAALGKTLEFQRQRAAYTPGTRDEQYYSGELQKWAQNKVEVASAYHTIGMRSDVPIPANRFEYAGDLAVEFLKGAPKKPSEVFSPVSGQMGAVLPGRKGLQDVAWETARSPGAVGTEAPASVSFMPGVDLLAAAEGTYGPYGKLRGGIESTDLTNRVVTQDRFLSAGPEVETIGSSSQTWETFYSSKVQAYEAGLAAYEASPVKSQAQFEALTKQRADIEKLSMIQWGYSVFSSEMKRLEAPIEQTVSPKQISLSGAPGPIGFALDTSIVGMNIARTGDIGAAWDQYNLAVMRQTPMVLLPDTSKIAPSDIGKGLTAVGTIASPPLYPVLASKEGQVATEFVGAFGQEIYERSRTHPIENAALVAVPGAFKIGESLVSRGIARATVTPGLKTAGRVLSTPLATDVGQYVVKGALVAPWIYESGKSIYEAPMTPAGKGKAAGYVGYQIAWMAGPGGKLAESVKTFQPENAFYGKGFFSGKSQARPIQRAKGDVTISLASAEMRLRGMSQEAAYLRSTWNVAKATRFMESPQKNPKPLDFITEVPLEHRAVLQKALTSNVVLGYGSGFSYGQMKPSQRFPDTRLADIELAQSGSLKGKLMGERFTMIESAREPEFPMGEYPVSRGADVDFFGDVASVKTVLASEPGSIVQIRIPGEPGKVTSYTIVKTTTGEQIKIYEPGYRPEGEPTYEYMPWAKAIERGYTLEDVGSVYYKGAKFALDPHEYPSGFPRLRSMGDDFRSKADTYSPEDWRVPIAFKVLGSPFESVPRPSDIMYIEKEPGKFIPQEKVGFQMQRLGDAISKNLMSGTERYPGDPLFRGYRFEKDLYRDVSYTQQLLGEQRTTLIEARAKAVKMPEGRKKAAAIKDINIREQNLQYAEKEFGKKLALDLRYQLERGEEPVVARVSSLAEIGKERLGWGVSVSGGEIGPVRTTVGETKYLSEYPAPAKRDIAAEIAWERKFIPTGSQKLQKSTIRAKTIEGQLLSEMVQPKRRSMEDILKKYKTEPIEERVDSRDVIEEEIITTKEPAFTREYKFGSGTVERPPTLSKVSEFGTVGISTITKETKTTFGSGGILKPSDRSKPYPTKPTTPSEIVVGMRSTPSSIIVQTYSGSKITSYGTLKPPIGVSLPQKPSFKSTPSTPPRIIGSGLPSRPGTPTSQPPYKPEPPRSPQPSKIEPPYKPEVPPPPMPPGGGGIPAGGSSVGPGYRGKYSKTYINPVGADILGATRGVPLKVPSRKKFKPPKFKMPKF